MPNGELRSDYDGALVRRYLILLTNDSNGAAQMLGNLTSGWTDYETTIQRFDGELEALYPVSGRFDAVAVARFPDEGNCLAFSLAASAGGQNAEVMPIYEEGDLYSAEKVHSQALRRFAAASAPEEDEPEGR